MSRGALKSGVATRTALPVERPESLLERHIARGPDHVVLAIVTDKKTYQRCAIFSNVDKAKAWVDALPPSVEAVFSPYIIDVPDSEAK